MKHFACIFVLWLLPSTLLFGQQEWLYTMQALNLYDGNGAAAGMYERQAIHLRLRSQWLGMEGAPRTGQMSYHKTLGDRLAIGTRWMSEQIGAFDRSRALIHLGWRTRLGKGQLSFALGGGLGYERMLRERVDALHPDDPGLQGNLQQWTPLVSAAVLYRNENLFAGVELNRGLRGSSQWGLLSSSGPQQEVLLMLGSSHAMSPSWSIRPMLGLRYSDSGALLPELQAGAWYRNTLWFGGGYRLNSAAYAFAEFRIQRKYRIAYSFGWPTHLQSPGMAAHHELMLGIFWGKVEQKNIQSFRYFQ